MSDEKVIYRDFDLKIIHYKGDQTQDEIIYPCDKCLFKRESDLIAPDECALYNALIKDCMRLCISNYRIDRETLVDAMRRKMLKDDESFAKWIADFPKYMGESDDAKLYVIKSPDDMIKVAEDLEKVLGE